MRSKDAQKKLARMSALWVTGKPNHGTLIFHHHPEEIIIIPVCPKSLLCVPGTFFMQVELNEICNQAQSDSLESNYHLAASSRMR